MQENGPGGRSSAPESDWRLVLVATLSVFAVYAISTWSRTLPIISQDELGFISQSQLLGGVPAVNMGSAPYYHFGFSLLLVPVWWITQDPLLAYKGFMLINAVLAALLLPVLVAIAGALGFRRSPLLILAAAVVALWPSYFMVAHYAWSEAMFRLVFAVHVLALLRLVVVPRIGWAVLFAVTAAALYAVHPKALLILLLAPVTLVALRVMRALDTRTMLVALAALVVVAGGAMLAMGYLHGLLWHEGGYSTERAMLARLLRPEALLTGLTVLLGQLWYQMAASLGLAAIGIWYVLRFVARPGVPAIRWAVGYVLAAALAIALASVGQMLDPQRVDHIAYGRYIDGASVLLVWLGLCWLVFGERGEGQRAAGLVGIGIVLLGGAVLAVLPIMGGLVPAHPENVAGIGWTFLTGSTPLQFFGINAVLMAVVAGLLLLLKPVGRLALVGVFVLGSTVVISTYLAVQSRAQLQYLSADASAVRATGLAPLYWTDEVRDQKLWSYHLQYTLGASFSERGDALPVGAGLISAERGGDGLVCAAALSNGLFVLADTSHAPGC